ncbi:MAG TPA: metalloregulator ArsR/SmtB family transcription factor [Candidatus Dormibacteraeota bacterium]|nr:metalloregulator ArsR/SmtB family transcription factor [Candidatus Dormibacteraeota bacterium]
MTALTALAEPHRLLIVELLRNGPRPVGEIADKLQLNQPQVSKHLRVLTDAGVVEVHPIAQQRIYSLRPQAFREIDDWLEPYRRLMDDRYNRLNDYLRRAQAKEKRHARKN